MGDERQKVNDNDKDFHLRKDILPSLLSSVASELFQRALGIVIRHAHGPIHF